MTEDQMIEDVRVVLSRRLISNTLSRFGTNEIFLQSQTWEGYNPACEAWHQAFWEWVDKEMPSEAVKKLKNWPDDCSKSQQVSTSQLAEIGFKELPINGEDRTLLFLEFLRQDMAQQFALFVLGRRSSEASNPAFYDSFSDDIAKASKVGFAVDTYWKEIANLTARKPAKGEGDRQLKYQLLYYWIRGCLWAFKSDGIGAFLDSRNPRSEGKPYGDKTISDACRELKLYRPTKPLWWGVAGNPPRLQEL